MECPICNMEVDNVESHAMEEAKKGDKSHKDAMEKMSHEGHSHQ